MPVEAEDGGDGADGEGFKEKCGKHEEHGGDERNRRTELGGPVTVGGDADHSGEGEEGPQRRLQPRVPRRGQVAQVVDGDVGHGGYGQAGVLRRPPHGLRVRLRNRRVMEVKTDWKSRIELRRTFRGSGYLKI